MKKLLAATMFISALSLIACSDNKTSNGNEKTEVTAVKKTSYSQNVPKDIKSDLEKIQSLSNSQAQEALKFQTEITEALQKGNVSGLNNVVDHLKTYTKNFNISLDKLELRSSEGNKIRDDMKAANLISVELAETGMKTPPDIEKIQAIQQKSIEIQQSLLQDMQAAQEQASSIN